MARLAFMVIPAGQMLAAAIAVCVLLPCGCESREAEIAAADGGGKKEQPVMLTVSQPVTLEVKLPERDLAKLRAQLAGTPEDAARLLAECVYKEHKERVTSIRVFAEKPEAGPKTPIKDPRYIGSFVPHVEDKQKVVMNLAPFLRLQGQGEWKEKTPGVLKFTFVLITEEGAEAKVEIGKVSLDFSRD